MNRKTIKIAVVVVSLLALVYVFGCKEKIKIDVEAGIFSQNAITEVKKQINPKNELYIYDFVLNHYTDDRADSFVVYYAHPLKQDVYATWFMMDDPQDNYDGYILNEGNSASSEIELKQSQVIETVYPKLEIINQNKEQIFSMIDEQEFMGYQLTGNWKNPNAVATQLDFIKNQENNEYETKKSTTKDLTSLNGVKFIKIQNGVQEVPSSDITISENLFLIYGRKEQGEDILQKLIAVVEI